MFNKPSLKSLDPIDRNLAVQIHVWKKQYRSKTIDPLIVNMLKKNGIFEWILRVDCEELACIKAKEVVEFIKMFNKIPSATMPEFYNEKPLGIWIKFMRRGKAMPHKYNFYQAAEDILLKNGFDILKHSVDKDPSKDIVKCRETCEFIKANKRQPSQYATCPIEKNLGKWLYFARKGNRLKNNIHPAVQDVANQYKMQNLFDKNRESDAVKLTIEYCNFYKTHGRRPARSQDKHESSLFEWHYNMKRSLEGKGQARFYPFVINIARENGVENFFNINNAKESNEQKARKMCEALICFITANGRNPSKGSKNSDEKKLANWHSNIKVGRLKSGTAKWYPFLQDMAEQAGLPNLFN